MNLIQYLEANLAERTATSDKLDKRVDSLDSDVIHAKMALARLEKARESAVSDQSHAYACKVAALSALDQAKGLDGASTAKIESEEIVSDDGPSEDDPVVTICCHYCKKVKVVKGKFRQYEHREDHCQCISMDPVCAACGCDVPPGTHDQEFGHYSGPVLKHKDCELAKTKQPE